MIGWSVSQQSLGVLHSYKVVCIRAKAADAAERARIVNEFLSRRREAAANRARAEVELGWKVSYLACNECSILSFTASYARQ